MQYHSQGFGGINILWMQILEENTGAVWGVDFFEIIVYAVLRGRQLRGGIGGLVSDM